jgi:prepilin-type N-terminal cleavage/methylation domain-containing protein
MQADVSFNQGRSIPHLYKSGFTLLELAIVITIIATLTGMGIMAGVNMLESARIAQTNNKIALIERALWAFRVSNNRLPCPASLTLPPTSASFGAEGPNNADCVSGVAGAATATSLTANADVAEGAIPTKQLNLPDDLAFDGWGSRFRYAVSTTYVGLNSFATTPLNDECGGISVRDGTGVSTFRTQQGAWAIISHGANAHGAHQRSGAIKNSGSTNVYEQGNCSCDATASSTTYAANYTQRSDYRNPAVSTDVFDDIVSYRLRWQLAHNETQVEDDGKAYLVLQESTTTNVMKLCGRRFVPDKPVQSTGRDYLQHGLTTRDGRFLANVSGAWARWPNFWVYERGSAQYDILPNPGGFGSSDGTCDTHSSEFSRDGRFLYISGSCDSVPGNRAILFMQNGTTNVFNRLVNPFTPNILSTPTTVQFASRANYMAAALWSSPFLRVYEYNDSGVFTELSAPPIGDMPPAPPGGVLDGVSISADGVYIAVAQLNSNGCLRLYKRTGSTFARIVDFGGETGEYLAIAKQYAPPLVYKRSADVFTQITSPVCTACGDQTSVSWSYDSQYLATGGYNSPGNRIWRRSGDTFSPVPNTVDGAPRFRK